MDARELLETVGGLIAHLKAFRAKLPDVVHTAVVPSGVKPTLEAIEAYEKTGYRFREAAKTATFRRLNELFIESLESFEAGHLLDAVHPILMALDQIEAMEQEKTITVPQAEKGRVAEYRKMLHKILPGNQPELEGAGRGL